MSLIIYINGIICHTTVSCKYHNLIIYYDIFINLILIIYGNLNTCYGLITHLITIFSFLIYFIKDFLIENYLMNQIIHVIFIQFPLGFCSDLLLKCYVKE